MPSKNNTISPNVVAAFYFAICTFSFNLLAKYFLYIFKMGSLLPLISSSLLSVVLGALFGSLFGQRLAMATKLTHIFSWGTLLAITMIPFYSLGLQLIYYLHNHAIYQNLHQWQDYFVLYGVMLLFFLLIAGIWFIPFTGVAALYFTQSFLPGCTAYYSKQEKNSIKAIADDSDTN